MQNRAKSHVPVKTGALKSSITHRAFNPTQWCFIYGMVTSTTVKYAPYVEFGTGIKISNTSISKYKFDRFRSLTLTLQKV